MMKNLRIIFLSMIVLLIVQPLFAQPFCNLAQGGVGFPADLACEVSVCDDDPFCCETVWDGVCAETANEDPNCITCRAYCNETYGNAGFAADEDCENAVCAADSFCCETEWDGICVDIAYSEPDCAGCLTPFCNQSQVSAGIVGFALEPACEDAVCAIDPFCCNNLWDLGCAGVALDQFDCVNCFSPGTPAPPCGLDIPADALTEAEDCGEDTNGGCNMEFPSFASIYCGQTLAGTAWADDDSRDTDWYLFTLASAGEVTVSGSAEFPFLLGIATDFESCDDFPGMLDEVAFGEFCGSASITVALEAGTHILFFAPSEFQGYPCEGENINYFVSLESDHCPAIYCNQAQTFPGFPTNQDCQDAVCAVDPFCCNSAWDGICGSGALSESSCADCIAYCDQALGIPGFPTNIGCETAVCAEDPFCCDTEWDGLCADAATVEPACADCLSALPEPCEPFEIPMGATPEMETCGEDTNGGCNSDPNEFGSVSCGETIHGTSWSSVESRDTDWYQFTLAEEAEVTMTGAARFDVLVAFINECNVGEGDIPVLEAFESCEIFTVSAVLPAGNYSAFVAHSDFVSNSCGSGLNDYYFTLDIASETPEISIDGDLVICPDESVVLSAPTGSAYEWAPGGEITQSITVSSAGTYSVTVTDGNGCVNTSGDVVVTENDAPTAVLSGGGTVCDGSSVGIEVNFTGTSPWSFTITDGDVEFIFDNVVTNPWIGTVGEIGTWTIVALSDANCSGTGSGSAVVVEDCPCEADAGMLEAVGETDCLEDIDGSTVMLVAAHVMDPVVPAGYETVYVLTEGAGLVIIDVNTDEPEFSVDAAGDYTIHTLVYDPATLDLEIVEIGTTTGFDVNSLLEQGGGDICGALDVAGASFTVEDCLPTGVSDFSDGNLQVFPNPSNGQFVIQLQSSVGQGVIRVVDISGRQVFHREVFLNSRFRTDVDLQVAPGTYILQIIAPEGTATRKLEVL